MFDHYGAYTGTQPGFTTPKGIFTLHATESSSDEDKRSQHTEPWYDRSLGKTLDTFYHKETGEFVTYKRSQIYNWLKAGKITDIST